MKQTTPTHPNVFGKCRERSASCDNLLSNFTMNVIMLRMTGYKTVDLVTTWKSRI
jgi:hypothetical protein